MSLVLILTISNLQVFGTSIKSWTSSNFGLILQFALELLALECYRMNQMKRMFTFTLCSCIYRAPSKFRNGLGVYHILKVCSASFFTWFNFKYKMSEIEINLQNTEKLMYLLEWNGLPYSVFTISWSNCGMSSFIRDSARETCEADKHIKLTRRRGLL